MKTKCLPVSGHVTVTTKNLKLALVVYLSNVTSTTFFICPHTSQMHKGGKRSRCRIVQVMEICNFHFFMDYNAFIFVLFSYLENGS